MNEQNLKPEDRGNKVVGFVIQRTTDNHFVKDGSDHTPFLVRADIFKEFEEAVDHIELFLGEKHQIVLIALEILEVFS